MMVETRFKKTDIGEIPEEWEVLTFEMLCTPNSIVRGPFGGALKKEIFISSGFKVYEQRNAIYQTLKIGDYYIDKKKYDEMKRFAIKKGDFIVSCSGTIGKIFQIPPLFPAGIINQALLKFEIETKYVNPSFFYYYFSSSLFQYRIIDDTQGGAMKNLVGMDVFRKTIIPIPFMAEQQRIAIVLRDIDMLLSVLSKKIEKKRFIKQGVMQQLLTGEKRLDGFTESWVKKNIAEICTIKARIGWQGLKADEYLDYGNFVLITGTDFENGGINWSNCSFVSKERFEQDENIKIKQGDVLITKDGSIGKVAYLDFIPMEGTLNSGVFVVRPKDISNLNNNYLALFFKSKFFEDFIAQLKAGSTIAHLYQKDFIRLQLNYPKDLSEQAAIVTIFSDMDREIEALEAKRVKYEQVKQGMMQQLLTGKIRLID